MQNKTPTRQHQGFTLIEILVVILIVGIASGVALLAFGDFGASRKAIVTAEHFAAYVKLVQQRAILEMTTLGIDINQSGYETFRFEQGLRWEPMARSSPFHRQYFPTNVIVSLQSNIKNRSKIPDIIINPSGDMTEFKIYFGTPSQPKIVALIGQHDGVMVLQKDNL